MKFQQPITQNLPDYSNEQEVFYILLGNLYAQIQQF